MPCSGLVPASRPRTRAGGPLPAWRPSPAPASCSRTAGCSADPAMEAGIPDGRPPPPAPHWPRRPILDCLSRDRPIKAIYGRGFSPECAWKSGSGTGSPAAGELLSAGAAVLAGSLLRPCNSGPDPRRRAAPRRGPGPPGRPRSWSAGPLRSLRSLRRAALRP